jgi:hypothetical protein
LTKIISDRTVEGPYNRRARHTRRHASSETGSHQLQHLWHFHDQLSAAAAR